MFIRRITASKKRLRFLFGSLIAGYFIFSALAFVSVEKFQEVYGGNEKMLPVSILLGLVTTVLFCNIGVMTLHVLDLMRYRYPNKTEGEINSED